MLFLLVLSTSAAWVYHTSGFFIIHLKVWLKSCLNLETCWTLVQRSDKVSTFDETILTSMLVQKDLELCFLIIFCFPIYDMTMRETKSWAGKGKKWCIYWIHLHNCHRPHQIQLAPPLCPADMVPAARTLPPPTEIYISTEVCRDHRNCSKQKVLKLLTAFQKVGFHIQNLRCSLNIRFTNSNICTSSGAFPYQ